VDNFRQIDQQLTAWVDAHREEIVEKTRGILRIASVKGPAAEGAPFGLETRRALDFALEVAESHGLSARNVDGYAAHAEWRRADVAETAPIVGVLAHVDVVPAGDGWRHDPFGAEVGEGRIYARGAIDDKGPAMAGLFAIAAVKECNVPLSRRLRLILGADEESGGNFDCVAHYFQHEEMPATGFTPDAMFPLVYAEKGIASVELTRSLPEQSGGIRLVRLSGGLRHNMVPDRAEAVLDIAPELRAELGERLSTLEGISVVWATSSVGIEARGVSAHGSTPDQGVNAVAVLCEGLFSVLSDSPDLSDTAQILRTIHAWAKDITGGALGIAGSDDVAGPLTSNMGIARIEDGGVRLTINIRYPVTWAWEDLRGRIDASLAGTGYALAASRNTPPLYVPKDDPLIQTLAQVYTDETGQSAEPMTMGGGTYARVMKKGVAFGPAFPWADPTDGGAHEADECWPIDHLILATKIYARALARLGNQ
jgi:succinyl-diaminopimelate desuccinylase